MKCPCCQNEMASGVVQSARQIFFTTKAHKNWFIPDVEGNNEILLSSHYKIVAVYLKFDHVHIVKAVRYFGVIISCYFHGITSLFVIILYHNEGRTWTFQAEYH